MNREKSGNKFGAKARAEFLRARASDGSPKGLARSVAGPAYQRLISAEPTLRRAVPALIIAFLVTIGVGAVIQILDQHTLVIAETKKNLETLSQVIATRVNESVAPTPELKLQTSLDQAPPIDVLSLGYFVFFMDKAGRTEATFPYVPGAIGRPLESYLRLVAPVDHNASSPVLETETSSGLAIFVKVVGPIAVAQPRSNALVGWRSSTTLTVTLSATTGFVLLILGFAFHWQATRAREADVIYDTVRTRIDTALSRGRCGLWDWDLTAGKIFWSDSMFKSLGMEPRDEMISANELDDIVHPADAGLIQLINETLAGKRASAERVFRLLHARHGWVWFRGRFELVQEANSLHLLGIAVDASDQQAADQAALDLISQSVHESDAKQLEHPILQYGSVQRLARSVLLAGGTEWLTEATESASRVEQPKILTWYPPGLIRIFSLAIWISVIGALFTGVSLVVRNPMAVWAGSGLLMIGICVASLTVLRGQIYNEDAQ